VIRQNARNLADLSTRESVVLPKLYGPRWAIQIENRLASMPDHVDVGWPMIVRIDDRTETVEPENRRHNSSIGQIPKRLGLRAPRRFDRSYAMNACVGTVLL
jgi:hypothetical protein